MPDNAGPGQQTAQPLRALYSTACPQDVAVFAETAYPIGPVTSCRLLNRGYNDVYELATGSGGHYVIRLGGRRLRGIDNTAYETAFVDHLATANVPVAIPVGTRDGSFVATATLAEGPRPAVLFRYVDGAPAGEVRADYARAQGATLAVVHDAGRSYDGPSSVLTLDLDHLLWRPLGAIGAHPAIPDECRTDLSSLADRLASWLAEVEPRLSHVHCHGDCHGFNARISHDKDGTAIATFFDFDDGGPGWLSYDLAVFLWLTILNPERRPLWPPFLAGYRSIRPVSPMDLDAILLFVPIRHFWLMGDWAAKVDEWGLGHLGPDWFTRQRDRLLAWEGEHLSPSRLL